MRHITPNSEGLRFGICFLFLCLVVRPCFAQDIYDARQSVILEAIVQDDPPAITLQWVLDTANGGYTIWRKDKMDTAWSDSIAILDPGSTSWRDTMVEPGIGYEYQVLKSLPAFPTGEGSPNTGAGYIYAGIQLPPTHHHGACLVVIDSTFKYSLAPGIERLLADLEADGWDAQALYVGRNDPVAEVKSGIASWAESNEDIHQALFLFGRVPVPYSGEIAPDGHHSDHRGAWPCDGYYAELDSLWTDHIVNTTAAASSRNDNVPGDGKFDFGIFPSDVKLQVGRVDFSNMSKFPESEEQLLQRYLDKDHAWRTGKMQMMERGLIDNNFAGSLEGLGQSGWKNFAVMFGITDVSDLPFRQTLTGQSYLWSYGCGGGGPESASDISNTSNFTTDSLQTMFTMLFGSYFGDWDYPNDFLRAAIASRTCLASTWGNRPNWFLHHMALGGHIGYSTQVTMNNRGLYVPAFYGGYVSTALMGDPTLRMHVHPPVENVVASQAGLNIQLEWQDPVSSIGYYIYKKSGADTAYQLLNQVPVTGTTYTDACAEPGFISYMVRGVVLKTSGSGTYYNLSPGVTASIISNPSPFDTGAEIFMADPGQSNGSIILDPQGGCAPYSYSWDNGQTGNAIMGLAPGEYCVTISDCVGCTQHYCGTVEVSSSSGTMPGCISSRLYPNPVGDRFALELQFDVFQDLSLAIIDAGGRRIAYKQCSGRDIKLWWDTSSLNAGQYWLQIESAHGYMLLPFVKERK